MDGQDEEEIVGWKILSLQATSQGQDLNRIDLIMTSHENYLPVEAVEQLHGSDVADPVLVGDVSRCVAGLLVTQECWLLTL